GFRRCAGSGWESLLSFARAEGRGRPSPRGLFPHDWCWAAIRCADDGRWSLLWTSSCCSPCHVALRALLLMVSRVRGEGLGRLIRVRLASLRRTAEAAVPT